MSEGRSSSASGPRPDFAARAARGSAFTLIELLVVLAILAILAALLMAGLNRATVAADSATCRNNLRQIAMGMHLYVQQGGTYPEGAWWPRELPPFVGAPWPEGTSSWTFVRGTGYMTNYVDAPKSVYCCPGYRRLRGVSYLSWNRLGIAALTYGSYAYNSYGWADAWGRLGPVPPELWSQGLGGILSTPLVWPHIHSDRPTPENRVVCPSDMIAFGDAPLLFTIDPSGQRWPNNPFGRVNFDTAFFYDFPSFYQDPAILRLTAQRHKGRWNVVFCDAHVENLRTRDIFDFSNPNVARRWNSDDQPHNQGWTVPPPP